MPNMVELMKKAAIEAVEASSPSGIFFGTVVSPSPLKINVEQRLTLEEPQLILSTLVSEFTVNMTVDHYTQNETEHTHAVQDTYTGGGSSSPTSHLHAYRGTKAFRVHLRLQAGEKVILLRVQGGQKFIVLDRVR